MPRIVDDLEQYVYQWASQNWPSAEGRDEAKIMLMRKEIEKQAWDEARRFYLTLFSGRQ